MIKLIGRSYSAASPNGTAMVPEVVEEPLRYSVRRGRVLVATFAQRSDAGNWARDFSNIRDTKSIFVIHTAEEILCAYQDGEEVEVP
jgi:hypothetical protein